MVFQEGDIADFAHIAAIPHVEFATVDRRINDVVSKVFRKLGQRRPQVDLSARVCPNVSALLAKFDRK